MSSFRRRTDQGLLLPGTRPSPFNAVPVMSTGLNSVDDLLGGGLALGSMMLVEQDHPTSYSDLLVDAFVAQGLDSDHDVLVLASSLDGIAGRLLESRFVSDDVDDAQQQPHTAQSTDNLKIAFRYDKMKHVASSVPETASASQAGVPYCSLFDMTARRPLKQHERDRVFHIDTDAVVSVDDLVSKVQNSIPLSNEQKTRPVRIVLPASGTLWYRFSPEHRFAAFLRLRRLLHQDRHSKHVCFFATLPSASGTTTPRCDRHLFDAVIRLRSFAGAPASEIAFPRHQGLVDIPRVPSVGTLVGGGVKLSVLRKGGNLGFRVKRKRFVIENVGEEVEPANAAASLPPPTSHASAVAPPAPADDDESSTSDQSLPKKSRVKFAPIVLESAVSPAVQQETRKTLVGKGPIDF